MGFVSNQQSSIMKDIRKVFPGYRMETEYSLGQRLFLDIYIPDISVGIEINGIQHYEFVPYFHGTISKFEEYKMLDKKKVRLCEEQNIGLYTVKYNEKFDICKFMDFIIQHLHNEIKDTLDNGDDNRDEDVRERN